jgi:U5 small nuclear ribonucleoprotein component
MATFEDYDEFGNYIGADLESDDEADVYQQLEQQPTATVPLEGYDDVPMREGEDMALMEVDGIFLSFWSHTESY